MSEFWSYFQIGLRHVLDISAYDHVLFLIALTVPYAFKDWKRVLILVSLFTLGHTLSLILSVYGMVAVNPGLVEFMIPITILVTALFHLFTAGKSSKTESISIIGFITLFFGIIHGLGFSTYFNQLLPGKASDKLLPLLEFALGIEAAQIIVVLIVLILSYIVQTFFRFSKRDWTLVMASFVTGVVLPMIADHWIWNKH
jgi:HupE/UreJ protein